MKPAIRFTLPLACLAALTTMVGGDPEPQPQINFTQAGLGTFKADWQGVAGRTYFTQFSLDHVTWRYAPFIDCYEQCGSNESLRRGQGARRPS